MKMFAKLGGLVASGLSTVVIAGGDSGTQSMGEMNLTGAQFGMLLLGVVVLGLVIWVVVKLMNK